jgi:single-stranded-DNA-specific exonuclease
MPAERLPELKVRLRSYAEVHLAGREPERVVKIQAELPLDRITTVLAGWLRKLEPLGHGNPEPVFVARDARLLAAPRIMKERHLRLELAQEPAADENGARLASAVRPGGSGAIRAVGWGLAERAMELRLEQGNLIDVAYRIRENDHPDFGGLEIEMVDVRSAMKTVS